MNNERKKGIRLIYLILIIFIILLIIFFVFKITNKNNKYLEQENEIKKQTIGEEETNNSTKDEAISFNIKDIKCKKGQEINVEIELLNESNFVAANFEYKYDSENLEYTNYEVGSSLKDAAMTIVNNDEENSKILIGFVGKPQEEKAIKAGNIINLKFKVKEKAIKDKITNEFACTTLKDESGKDIKYNIKQGTIIVE